MCVIHRGHISEPWFWNQGVVPAFLWWVFVHFSVSPLATALATQTPQQRLHTLFSTHATCTHVLLKKLFFCLLFPSPLFFLCHCDFISKRRKDNSVCATIYNHSFRCSSLSLTPFPPSLPPQELCHLTDRLQDVYKQEITMLKNKGRPLYTSDPRPPTEVEKDETVDVDYNWRGRVLLHPHMFYMCVCCTRVGMHAPCLRMCM